MHLFTCIYYVRVCVYPCVFSDELFLLLIKHFFTSAITKV